MANFVNVIFGILFIHSLSQIVDAEDSENKKCSTLPQVQHRLNAVILECQNQVKENMIRDALQQLRYSDIQPATAEYPGYPLNANVPLASDREDIHWMLKRFRRDLGGGGGFYDHPTVMSNDDKEIAGCLMKCFFKKTNALDFFGYPTLDGLVNLYTENVADHQYFMAVLKITNFCLKGVSIKYKINQATGSAHTETCNVAFDTFDCISDQIMDYCSSGVGGVKL